MDTRQYRRRIVIIVLLVVVIASILLMLSYNLFSDRNLRENTTLRETSEVKQMSDSEAFLNERTYHIIYESSDERSVVIKENCERMLKILKLPYTVADISAMKAVSRGDYMILTVYNWTDHITSIESIFEAVSHGASLLLAVMPGQDSVFRNKAPTIGIYNVSHYPRIADEIHVLDDVIVGLNKGDSLSAEPVRSEIYDIHLDDRAKVYLTDEKGISEYFTITYGKGIVGVYNGSRLVDRSSDGLIVSMLGTLNDGLVYPLINAGVMFLDDWPAPFTFTDKDIYEQYGMNYDNFLKYVWWPDMLSLILRYDLTFSATLVLSYNDIQSPPFEIMDSISNSAMYVHYQQVIEHGGEICLHGYNHQPLWFGDYVTEDMISAYTPWPSKKNAVDALDYTIDEFHKAFQNYALHCYVPPSNVIDETGIEVLKETVGRPVILSSIYYGYPPEQPEFEYEVKDDVIYFPRLTSGSRFNDEIKYYISTGMTTYGVFSHFIHPDDVVDDERSFGMTWEEMRHEYEDMFLYIEERYPFLEYDTISNCANKLIDWYGMDYSISYESDAIRVRTANAPETYSLMVRTDSKIAEGEGYTFIQLGTRSYVVTATQPEIAIMLESGE